MPVLRTRETDSSTLPTLSIIAPTPRTFTFPTQHNLSFNDSPYSSRSNSPFEPELRPLASSCTTFPSTLIRTLSPVSDVEPSTRRRKSASTDAERRPKKGDQDYVKRPENAFILFRRKCCEDRQQALEEAGCDAPGKKQRQADLSKTISQQWKGLSAHERHHWELLAKEKKKEHEQMHPGYVYRPQRSRDKDGKLIRKKSKAQRALDTEHGTDSDSLSFVLPITPRNHGRSASAPTPPPAPYQSILVPNVYQMTPSCPTSPSLLPMISRRSAHPGHPDEIMADFDFLPSDNIAYGQTGMEQNLQSSALLRSMFTSSAELSPLDVSHSNMLLPSPHIISPASSIGSASSGPSSPNMEPFTPTSEMLTHPFSNLDSTDSSCNGDLSMGLQYHLHQEFDNLGYNSYSWGGESAWSAGCDLQLGGDDFDVNLIPPIELTMPKYDEYHPESSYEYQHYSQEHHPQNQYLESGLLGYDDIEPAQGF